MLLAWVLRTTASVLLAWVLRMAVALMQIETGGSCVLGEILTQAPGGTCAKPNGQLDTRVRLGSAHGVR